MAEAMLLSCRMTKAKLGDAVLVEWQDSYGCSSSWQELDGNISARAMVCRSLGWLRGLNSRCVTVVPHIAKNDLAEQGCGDMTIPAAAIIRIIPLAIGSQSAANVRACDSEPASKQKQRRS